MNQPHYVPFGPKDIFVAAIVNLLIGLNIVAVKFAVVATGPFTAGAARLLVVLIVALPFFRAAPGRTALVAAFGLLNGGLFPATMNLALLVSDNVSALAIAGQLSVPLSLILGAIFLKEHLTLPRAIGVALAFAGVVVLVFDPKAVDDVPGLLIMILAALLWAIGTLLQRRLGGMSVLTICAWNGLMGSALLVPLSLSLEPQAVQALPAISMSALGWILFSALATVVGQGGLAWLLQRHPVPTVMPLMLTSTVISVVSGVLVFHTPVTPLMILGGVVALAGVAVVTLYNARSSRAPDERATPPA